MSDKKFDKKIRETLENHDPKATADWGKMKERLAAVAALGAIGVGAASTRVISQLSISAAVILGSATFYVVQRYLTSEIVFQEEALEVLVEDDIQGGVKQNWSMELFTTKKHKCSSPLNQML